MNTVESKLPVLIARAALMRAHGKGWAAVAVAVGRSADTVRRWPEHFPDTWAAAYRAAAGCVIADCAIEAQLCLRAMLRAGRDRDRLAAAKVLLRLRAASTARPRRRPRDPIAKRPAQTQHDFKAAMVAELERRADRRSREHPAADVQNMTPAERAGKER